VHGVQDGTFAERDYGVGASVLAADVAGRQIAWYRRHLDDPTGGDSTDAPVRVFVMGADEWRDLADWPPPESSPTPLYLRSGGHANTAAGDGRLDWGAPASEPEDELRYDPRDPVPTFGGATFLPGLAVAANGGPRDQRAVEMRPDVLCYTTPALERPLELIGHVELVLFASSSAPSTDFTGKLVDVHPDGRAELLTDGILRVRSISGSPTELRIDLGATAARIAAGHRLRLEVSSSNFPRFDRNPNTGASSAEVRPDDLAIAHNRVHHDGTRPSHLILPVNGN
jgi:putative CocE/NonD family hydrolase